MPSSVPQRPLARHDGGVRVVNLTADANEEAGRVAPPFGVASMLESDLDAVFAIESRIYPFPWTRGNFADSLQSGYDCWCFVAADRRLLGYAILMWAVDEVHLLNLAVDAPWQGRRLGEAFLDWVRQDCRRRGALSLLLEVRPSNPRALALYLRCGFHRIGVRRGYYPAGVGLREDAIVMRLALGVVDA